MNHSKANKEKALGMNFSTASNRLKKQLLFKYVILAGDNICFACKEPIEDVRELSVEHKEPWNARDAIKFWDLNNIAFSHIKCNWRRVKWYNKGS